MSLITEENGKTSSMRFGFLIWILAFAISFVYCSIMKEGLQEVSEGVIYLTIVLTGGKLIQKPFEVKK